MRANQPPQPVRNGFCQRTPRAKAQPISSDQSVTTQQRRKGAVEAGEARRAEKPGDKPEDISPGVGRKRGSATVKDAGDRRSGCEHPSRGLSRAGQAGSPVRSGGSASGKLPKIDSGARVRKCSNFCARLGRATEIAEFEARRAGHCQRIVAARGCLAARSRPAEGDRVFTENAE
jgi:hypothetical protein